MASKDCVLEIGRVAGAPRPRAPKFRDGLESLREDANLVSLIFPGWGNSGGGDGEHDRDWRSSERHRQSDHLRTKAVCRSCRNFYSAAEARIARRIITRLWTPPMWPDARLLDLLGIEHPIIQAPMAGAVSPEMVIQVSEAGGLGSLPCAMLTPDQARNDLGVIRQRTSRPVNLNFFCHTPSRSDPAREARWRDRLRPYYAELGIDAEAPNPAAIRNPVRRCFLPGCRGVPARGRQLPFRVARL